MIDFLKELVLTKMFKAGLSAFVLSQTIKVITNIFIKHRLDFRLFVSMGGMPSGHSAYVMALSTAIGFNSGWGSSVYLCSLGFALLVIVDAAGVRRAAGRQAKVLNQIMESLSAGEKVGEKKLRELLGHTPVEVILGGLLGILIAILLQ